MPRVDEFHGYRLRPHLGVPKGLVGRSVHVSRVKRFHTKIYISASALGVPAKLARPSSGMNLNPKVFRLLAELPKPAPKTPPTRTVEDYKPVKAARQLWVLGCGVHAALLDLSSEVSACVFRSLGCRGCT